MPPYHQTLFCEEQNHPTLNPLIQVYSLGYREAGCDKGAPRSLGPGPRTIKIGPSNPQKVGCIQMSVQIIAFASEPISAKLLILLT